MFDKKIFSSRICELRKAAKINQAQLGEIIGVSQFAVSKMEKAQRAASVEVIYELCKYFNVSADYLLGLSDDPTRR